MIVSTFAPNQILITEDNGNRHFKSYNTNVASVINGKVTVSNTYWKYGQTATTNRYLAYFLGVNGAGFKKYVNSEIANGNIILTENLQSF